MRTSVYTVVILALIALSGAWQAQYVPNHFVAAGGDGLSPTLRNFGYIGLSIDGGYVNFTRVEELINSSQHPAPINIIAESGEVNYLVYVSGFYPSFVIEAYNSGGKAIIALHYITDLKNLMWWFSLSTDQFIAVDRINNISKSLGWSVLDSGNRSRYKCTTVTVTCTPVGNTTCPTIPPICVSIVETYATLEKEIAGNKLIAEIWSIKELSNSNHMSIPQLSITVYAERPDSKASYEASRLVEALTGLDYSPSWNEAPKNGPDIERMGKTLLKEIKYLVSMGMVSADNISLTCITQAIHSIKELNQVVEIATNCTHMIAHLKPPDPLQIVNDLDYIPCNPVLNPPYCTIVTTVTTRTGTSGTTSAPTYVATDTDTFTSGTSTGISSTATFTNTETLTGAETLSLYGVLGMGALALILSFSAAIIAAVLVWAVLRRE